MFNLSTRFEPKAENNDKQKFDNAVEGLRGLAALWVAHSHAFINENIDPNYQIPSIFGHFTVGREAVQIFFVLSGYVIGLSCKSEFSKNNAFSYLLKRIIRLYPMYLLSIFISVLLYPRSWPIQSLQEIIGNIFFMQNLVVPTIYNGVLWSLNYEVIYYLVFLFIWRFRPKLILILVTITMVMTFIWIFNPSSNNILAGYLVGWLFWLLGLLLAWKTPSNTKKIKVPLLSLLLLFYANKELRLGTILLDVLHWKNPGCNDFTFGDLVSLPICTLLFATVSNRVIENHIKRWLYVIVITMPFAAISYSFIKNYGSFHDENFKISAIEIFLAIIFFWLKCNQSVLNYLGFFGSVSYGIYIFHIPIIWIVENNFPISGSLWSFMLRYILWAILTVALAYLMDIKIQKKIRNWCHIYI
jgi:peptidoglycan/LPS O-acetylase OafA/YrhL